MLFTTIFAFTSLRSVEGLETCKHEGPSTIDYYTLTASGPLPEVFLRGCGLPHDYVRALRSFWEQESKYFSCFISYSTRDDAFVQRLYADLWHNGVRCYCASHDLKIGEKFRARIDEAIQDHEKLLIVLSRDSTQSAWVEKEVETAFEKETKEKRLVLFPIRLDGTVMKTEAGWAADIRRTRHIGNFSEWKDHDAYSRGLEKLLRDLRRPASK